MSDIDLSVRCSRAIELHLRDAYGADGRGLHELITDAEPRLTAQQVRDLRFVASVRNTVVHEAAELTDEKRGRLQEITDAFLATSPGRSGGRKVVWPLLAAAAAAAAAYVVLR